MSDVAKPGADGKEPTSTGGTEGQPNPSQDPAKTPAEPTVELSDEQKAYLKGIGVDDVNSFESIQKLIDTSIKQKSSVSKTSRELEELRVRLTTQGKPIEVELEEEPTPKPEPQAATPPAAGTVGETSNGVSDNDLFDLTRMFNEFPELADQAQDGRIFAELRQLGYFGTEGIRKKEIYEHLAGKNAEAKELRELREFKAKHSTPNPESGPQYDPSVGLNLKGEMTGEVARQIIMQGNKHERFDEARQFLQSKL